MRFDSDVFAAIQSSQGDGDVGKLNQSLLVGGCILGCLMLAALAALFNHRDPACSRLQARVDLAKRFCDGLAERAAQEKCSALVDAPEEVRGQCLRIIRPAAFSGCMDYLSLEAMERDLADTCTK